MAAVEHPGPAGPAGPTPAADGDGAAPTRHHSGVVYVFEPNRKELPPLREYLTSLWERRRFMVALTRAEVKGSRSSMVLGELWGVIDPLFQAALYSFLIVIIRGGGGGPGGLDSSGRLALMVGCMFVFNFMSVAITDGGRSILKSKSLMLNSTFPRGLLPISSVYRALVILIPSMAVYLVFHLVLGQPIGVGVFVLPLVLAIAVVMSTGLAFLFASFTVFLRDTTNLLGYAMRVLFFATPVLYPVSFLPDEVRTVLHLNPFFSLFVALQAILRGGVPNPVDLLMASGWAVLFLVVGYRVFVTNERSFALRL